MPTIEVPGQGLVEFPDDMDDAAIAKAIRLNSPDRWGDDKPGVLQETLGGLKHSWDRAAYGLADLFGQQTPEMKGELQRGKDFVQRTGPMSTVGNIGGDIAQLAGPGAMAAGVKGLGKYGPAALDMLLGAGHGGLTAEEGEGAKGATWGAVGSGLGSAAGTLAAKALAPAGRISPEAQKLIDAGIPLTPAQAAPDSWLGKAEPWIAKVPWVGSNARARQAAAAAAVTPALGRTMGVPNLTATAPQEVIAQLRQYTDDAYSAAARQATDLNKNFKYDLRQAYTTLTHTRGIDPGIGKQLMRDLQLAQRQIAAAPDATTAAAVWKDMDALIGQAGERFKPLQDQWRASFHKVAPHNASAAFLRADLLDRQVRAIEKGVGTKTDVTPEQLVRGLRTVDIKPRAVEANAKQYVHPQTAASLSQQAAKVNELGDAAANMTRRHQSPWVLPQAAAALGAGAYWGGASKLLPAALAGAGLASAAFTKPGVKWATSQYPRTLQLAEWLRQGTGKQVARRLGTEMSEE